MQELMIFENTEFGKVRTVLKDGEVWFVGKDIAKALGYQKLDAMYRILEEDEQQTINPQGFPQLDGCKLEENPNIFILKLVNESGLYNAVFNSRKPEAKKFKKWVTSEVLPTIRKTGGYVANTRTFVDTYFSAMDEAGKEFLVLTLDKKLEVENELKKAKEVIEQQKPAVDFTKRLIKSKENILVREYAKILQDEGFNFGEKKLYAWLRENKFLMKNNEPYQKYMKYFVVIERVVQAMHGDILTRTTKITPEGQVYLFHKIKECN